LNELKKCIFQGICITSGTLTFVTVFNGSMNILYKCSSFWIKVNILFHPTQIMVLYEIESQDHSADIFIKMGKSNVSPIIPNSVCLLNWRICKTIFLQFRVLY